MNKLTVIATTLLALAPSAPKNYQSHRVGPMISGTYALGGKQALKYQLAVLYGSIYSVNGYMVSTRIQYVF